jgi:hypothetical protein
MLGKAVRIGIVATLVAMFGLATAAQAQEVHRLEWQYDGGFFKDQGLGNWVEKNWSGTYHFRDVHRNREFVELYDASRDVSVRLDWTVASSSGAPTIPRVLTISPVSTVGVGARESGCAARM